MTPLVGIIVATYFVLVFPVYSKTVGIFYATWFPFSTSWPNQGGCTWAEPELGYYASNDARIIDTHTEWLKNAGVDFVMFDWSNNCGNSNGDRGQNGNLWAIEDNAYAFAKRQIERKQQGRPFIQISIFLGTCGDCSNANNGVLSSKFNSVKQQYINDPAMNSVYFKLYGKPLIGVFGLTCEEQIASYRDDSFTYRPMTAGIKNRPWDKSNFWSWEEYLDLGYSVYNGRPEATTVRPALRGTGSAPGVVSEYPNGLPGWLNDGSVFGEATIGRRDGATFREQFQKAIDIGVEIIMIQSFNQWTGCQSNPGENYTPEFSNDVEPMKGGFGRKYLDLMKELIENFKGSPTNNPGSTPMFSVRNLFSKKVIDVSSMSRDNGGLIHQWKQVDGANQKWLRRLVPGTKKIFLLVNLNSGLCLDVPYFSKNSGVQLHQWSCHGGPNQQFQLKKLKRKRRKWRYAIISVNSNLCLTVLRSNRNSGSPVFQSTCTFKSNQRWLFIKN